MPFRTVVLKAQPICSTIYSRDGSENIVITYPLVELFSQLRDHHCFTYRIPLQERVLSIGYILDARVVQGFSTNADAIQQSTRIYPYH